MPSDVETIRAVERNLASMQPFDAWSIGIARAPDVRERELAYPAFWRVWDTDTSEQASSVRTYFLHKGMRDDGAHGHQPRSVYLF